MPLQIGFEPGGLDPKVVSAFDDLIAPLQVWANQVDGVNAAERLSQLTTGIAALPTVPTGAIFAWATATAPTGWLICDGASVSRTVYVTLFQLFGTAFGIGDGVTTFNLPNLQQKFILGKAASGTGSTLNGTGGTIDHTHTESNHTHTVSGTTSSDGSHSHTGSTGSAGTGASGHRHGFITVDQNLDALTQTVMNYADPDNAHSHTISSDGSHSHSWSATSSSAGAGSTSSSNPPFLALNYIVKT